MDVPTLIPAVPFDPLQDSTRLRDNLVSAFTDEADIIDVLCNRATDQRAVITSTYDSEFRTVSLFFRLVTLRALIL